MDNIKIDGGILAGNLSVKNYAGLTGLDFVTQKPTQAQSILPMIEQRIRDAVEPQVNQARADLEAIIAIELDKLGVKAHFTSLYQFTDSIAKQYEERLVAERIAALVDSLITPTQLTKDAP